MTSLNATGGYRERFNDFFVLDDDFVIFNVLDGSDNRVEQQLYQDVGTVKLCRGAFDAAWAVAVPHQAYSAR